MATPTLSGPAHASGWRWIALALAAALLWGGSFEQNGRTGGGATAAITSAGPTARLAKRRSLPRPKLVKVLAPGVVLRLYRLSSPAQRVSVILVHPSARFQARLLPAGRSPLSFATVSATVKRTHALAGVNGYFTSPPDADPMLVKDERIVKGPCVPPYCMRDPRTGFGLTADGTALLVTVDGRRPGATGLKRGGFAHLMRALGSVWAVNLDGGGSTTMVAGGRVVNRPSDRSRERRVRTILVLTRSSRPGVAPALRSLRLLDPRIVAPILLP